MAARRSGRPVHGWLVVDKPAGLSSAAVVGRVRRALDAAKAGHGGTLDPLATGVLPVALGEATKTVAYVMDGAKAYRFRVIWGEARAGDDAEGDVIAVSAVRPDAAAILGALPRFLGEIEQTPPAYSAIKVGGRRAYALARAGETPALASRRVRIESLELCGHGADWADFEMRCGKGTYVRALARDLALALGTVGHVGSLRRTRCGPYCEKDAISLAMIEQFGHSAAAANLILPIATALDDIPALAVTEEEARRLRCGQSVLLPADRRPLPPISAGKTVRAMAEGRLVALARIDDDGSVRAVRVINL